MTVDDDGIVHVAQQRGWEFDAIAADGVADCSVFSSENGSEEGQVGVTKIRSYDPDTGEWTEHVMACGEAGVVAPFRAGVGRIIRQKRDRQQPDIRRADEFVRTVGAVGRIGVNVQVGAPAAGDPRHSGVSPAMTDRMRSSTPFTKAPLPSEPKRFASSCRRTPAPAPAASPDRRARRSTWRPA